MACSFTEDVTVCSICFETFKTPRYLPCGHSFCEDCICSYIASQNESTEPRLGLLCPLCREFIPNICSSESPEEWVTHFPKNHALEKHVRSSGEIYCEACLRENEREEGTDFCFTCNEKLCKVCTKCHRRNLLTRVHKVIPLNESCSVGLKPFDGQGEMCGKHHERPIEACEQVKTVEETALFFKGEPKQNFDAVLKYVKILEEKLSNAKQQQEKFSRQLEEKADQISDVTEKMYEDAVNHLQFLKKQYLGNMATGVNKRKEKYEKIIQKLTDGIHCTKYCAKSLKESREKSNAAELVVMYHMGKKCVDVLKRYDFTQLQIEMEENKLDILENIMNLTCVSDVQFLEKTIKISDISQVQLHCISEFSLEGKFIRDGAFQSDGTFILSTLGCKNCQKITSQSHKDECFIYGKNGIQLEKVQSGIEPFGIVVMSGETFVASTAKKCIQKLTTLNMLKQYLHCNVKMFGIAFLQHNIYLACNDRIIKVPLNRSGFRSTYGTGTSVKHITSTKSHIVYSRRKTNEVIAMDVNGRTAWRYSSPNLKSPCGLGVDGEDNIYVAGKESDNVHVLGKNGKFIRVFEDITRPDFMKVDMEKRVCFVSSKRNHVRVYKMI